MIKESWTEWLCNEPKIEPENDSSNLVLRVLQKIHILEDMVLSCMNIRRVRFG